MNVIALETSTNICSIAVLKDGRLVNEINEPVKTGHTGTLLPMLDSLLKASGLDKKNIDLIAVGLGPGSFTGIRIGIATAKGLAAALDCRVAGISTLDIIAHKAASYNMPVMPVIDAKKGEIFCALYSESGELMTPYMNVKPAVINNLIKTKTLFAGNALDIYEKTLSENLGELFIKGSAELWNPRASVLGKMALSLDIEKLSDEVDVQPIYVRASDAAITLKNKEEKPQI